MKKIARSLRQHRELILSYFRAQKLIAAGSWRARSHPRFLLTSQSFRKYRSTKREYWLRQHAVALGWSVEHTIVINSDLGQSGVSAVDRERLDAIGGGFAQDPG